jgi:hypothetical protein
MIYIIKVCYYYILTHNKALNVFFSNQIVDNFEPGQKIKQNKMGIGN